MTKIFGIGLSRTGTTSLSETLSILGYRSKHFPAIGLHQGNIGIARTDLENFDALLDTPISVNYKALDKHYPNSKFIFTGRNIEPWLFSCQQYERFAPDFPVHPAILELRKLLYGAEFFDPEKFRQAYLDHEKDVDRHFAGRQNTLLKMAISDGDGWDVLCRFLDKSIPSVPFPHLNSGKLRAE